ncbi:MAG: 50S ribosomal protein L4 [Schleiferiaceae bacterium]|jgi:large subunit ribosomal protein L4|tara:strand:+ start:82552 stop:83184 length:633 start_codon:yes stop_codon:yes gene_type:complete
MEVNIFSQKGKDLGRKALLSDSVFKVDPNEHAVYLDVKQYLANQRQGTHKAKERSEISRTTKKLHKQKGTGGARHGSMRSPLYRGGGTVFGPRPHEYGFKLNKKLKIAARKSALSMMAAEDQIFVIDNISIKEPKTKEYSAFLGALGFSQKKCTVVLPEPDKNVYLSSRNFEGSNVVTASELNTYSILNAGTLILVEGAIEKIETALMTK